MIARRLQASSGDRRPVSSPLTGSPGGTAGDPAREHAAPGAAPRPARPGDRSHATVTAPGPRPPGPRRQLAPGSRRARIADSREAIAGQACLKRRVAATIATTRSRTRTPRAGRCPLGRGLVSATVPPPAPGPHRAGRRRYRRRAGNPAEGEGRTGRHSAPPAIPYSVPYTCRHRKPLDAENAQAVPLINLPADSQTNYAHSS